MIHGCYHSPESDVSKPDAIEMEIDAQEHRSFAKEGLEKREQKYSRINIRNTFLHLCRSGNAFST